MLSLANLFGSGGGGNYAAPPALGQTPQPLSGSYGALDEEEHVPGANSFQPAPPMSGGNNLSFLQSILQQLYGSGGIPQPQAPWSPVRAMGGGMFSNAIPTPVPTPVPAQNIGGGRSRIGGMDSPRF